MFDVGFTEILLIGIVALVVIGPERLPDVARNVGHYVGKLQRFVTGVKRDIRAELETGELKKLIGDQKEQLDELRQAVNSAQRQMDSGTRSMVGDAKKTLAGLEQAADNATPGAGTDDGPAAPPATAELPDMTPADAADDAARSRSGSS